MWQTIAYQPLSESLQEATGIAAESIGPEDFELFAKLCDESDQLPGERNIWLKEVRLYYRFLRSFRTIAVKALPSLEKWTESELVSCSRYAGAMLDRRLNADFAYASVAYRR
ncbi:MAG: hypothetical protein ACRD5K_05035 [Candidatus Acidiferrales bacterium]